MPFVKAKTEPANVGDPKSKFTVQYFDENGNITIRSGGTRAWRCNNPGNLRKSSYSTGKDRRSIGVAGYGEDFYAVYPDYETGHEALIVMFRGSKYFHLTLRKAIKRYDSTNPKYIDEIVAITKFDPERTIKSLSSREFEVFWKAIEQVEKWIVGCEDFIERWIIAGVHKKRGVIREYLVDQKNKSVWVSKPDAIDLAKQYKLRAILVSLKNGKKYLRPEYGQPAFSLIV